MTTPTVLVTGATGTVGRALVRSLVARGARVLAGSRTGQAVDGAPGRVVDFEQPDTLDAAFAGVDHLFLLFPLQPNKRELAAQALAAARRAGVAHVVRSSGAGADVASPYAIGRLQGEIDADVAASGLPYTLLRPSNFMQNWVNYYAGMVQAGQVYLPNGTGRSGWIDARDIADAAAAVLSDPAAHAGRCYELTGPEALNADELLAVLARETGITATYVPVTEAQAREQLSGMGLPAWTVDIMASLGRMIADGATGAVTPDLAQLLAASGATPRRWASFAREHAAAWR